MKQYVISSASTNKVLFAAVAMAAGIITRRAFLAALEAVKATKDWLYNTHTFCRDRDDPAGIELTGWQYIGFNAMAFVAMLLVSMAGD